MSVSGASPLGLHRHIEQQHRHIAATGVITLTDALPAGMTYVGGSGR
jgi:hypothetical protein